MRSLVTRRIGHVALLVALAVVPVLALNSLASAGTGTDPRPDPDARPTCVARQSTTVCGFRGRTTFRPPTDAQRRCLADPGVTMPARRGPAVRGVARACDLPVRVPHDERI
jgi:hypothetical protein